MAAALATAVIVAIVWTRKRWPLSGPKADWPETEGTIQSVNTVHYGRTLANVADFSYKANGEFFSGRAVISQGFYPTDDSTKALIDQKVRLSYDPTHPQKLTFPQQNVGGFTLNGFSVAVGEDVDPIDLNIA